MPQRTGATKLDAYGLSLPVGQLVAALLQPLPRKPCCCRGDCCRCRGECTAASAVILPLMLMLPPAVPQSLQHSPAIPPVDCVLNGPLLPPHQQLGASPAQLNPGALAKPSARLTSCTTRRCRCCCCAAVTAAAASPRLPVLLLALLVLHL